MEEMKSKYYLPLALILVAMLSLSAAGYYIYSEDNVLVKGGFTPAFSLESTAIIAEGETSAVKNETVYVLLDHQGEVTDQRIVNRIYDKADPDAGFIADYGTYLFFENMTAADTPQVEENRLLWPADALGSEDLYYEGKVDKTLPLEIEILYYLDGEEVSPEYLAGKSGKLELVFNFTNRLSYDEPLVYNDYAGNQAQKDDRNFVPLLVQGTLEVDLQKFTEIDPGPGLTLVMGQTASINFMAFPYPEETVRLSMVGEKIELNRITFMVAPQLPPLPDMDIEDALVQILEGIQLFSEGFDELSKGAGQVLQGLNRINEESERLTASADNYEEIIAGYLAEREEYLFMLETLNNGELTEALEQLQFLLGKIEAAPDPAAATNELSEAVSEAEELSQSLNELDSALADLNSSSQAVKSHANTLLEENQPGSPLHELGETLLAREAQIAGAIAANSAAEQNMARLSGSLAALQIDWLNNYLPGLQALAELGALSESLEMIDTLSSFSGELTNLQKYMDEIDIIIAESGSVLENLESLPAALEQLASGQARLTEGLEELNSGGFAAMESGLIDGINEARAGNAKLELMTKLAEDYRSYADNENNRLSEVRFIIQTPRLVAETDTAETGETLSVEEESYWTDQLWNKLTGLFK
jgi:putative membrane protein